ncbi:hypothetical protein B296_00015337 [Ensete ventricosum]|uniref:Uncharacterized protein n=1 Tax=Ensete ventricosum TaxID=4639 RepID=A0A426YYX5_ENSVE|nr:hypothetical protein B296_00015337 [Ensete ventricosum]
MRFATEIRGMPDAHPSLVIQTKDSARDITASKPIYSRRGPSGRKAGGSETHPYRAAPRTTLGGTPRRRTDRPSCRYQDHHRSPSTLLGQRFSSKFERRGFSGLPTRSRRAPGAGQEKIPSFPSGDQQSAPEGRHPKDSSPRQKGPIEKQIDVMVSGPASGGDNTSACKAYARIAVEKRSRHDYDPEITSMSGDEEYPDHDDALVISARITNARVKRIIVDTRTRLASTRGSDEHRPWTARILRATINQPEVATTEVGNS